MKLISTKDLRESLILLIPERYDDGEGGFREEWRKGPPLRASLWPLINHEETPHYRIIIRPGIQLPLRIGFLWPLPHALKRLLAIGPPLFIQQNQFLCMTAKEEENA